MKRLDLVGQRFGRLIVFAIDIKNKSGHFSWNCKCDCGNIITTCGNSLKRGYTKSCGCLQKEIVTTHGKSHAPEYKIWYGMKSRCENTNDIDYENYGGRGIKISKQWSKFKIFFNDMGPRPNKNYSIDRINNNGNYCLENCRWATQTTQNHNKRIRKDNLTGYQGVDWDKTKRKYRVRIGNCHKRLNIGHFKHIEDAITARKDAELKYWGKN